MAKTWPSTECGAVAAMICRSSAFQTLVGAEAIEKDDEHAARTKEDVASDFVVIGMESGAREVPYALVYGDGSSGIRRTQASAQYSGRVYFEIVSPLTDDDSGYAACDALSRALCEDLYADALGLIFSESYCNPPRILIESEEVMRGTGWIALGYLEYGSK